MARFVGPFTAVSVAHFHPASVLWPMRAPVFVTATIMTEQSKVPPGLETELEPLQKRVASVRDNSKHVAGNPPATNRKLAEIGRQLASLKSELAEIAAEKTRAKKI
jgi:hypothetical protein